MEMWYQAFTMDQVQGNISVAVQSINIEEKQIVFLPILAISPGDEGFEENSRGKLAVLYRSLAAVQSCRASASVTFPGKIHPRQKS